MDWSDLIKLQKVQHEKCIACLGVNCRLIGISKILKRKLIRNVLLIEEVWQGFAKVCDILT